MKNTIYHQTLDVPANIQRLLIVGDIHAHYSLLFNKLSILKFNSDTDYVLSVGDIIDRGNESEKMIHVAMTKKWFHMVRGNHEQMLSDAILLNGEQWSYSKQKALDFWLENGGKWSEQCHSELLINFSQWIEKLPFALTVKAFGKQYGISHAGSIGSDWSTLSEDLTIPGNRQKILWKRKPAIHEIKNIDFIFQGHQSMPEVKPFGNTYYLDSNVYNKNKFFIAEVTNTGVKLHNI